MGKMQQIFGGAAVVAGLGAVVVAGYAGEPFGAEARARLAPFHSVLSNAEEHRTERRGGYEFTVHPGFSSGATVQVEGQPVQQLYRQQGVFNLPAGQTAPPTRHAVRLTGGEHARDVGLVVDDPKHQVARVIVELYDESHKPGFSGTGQVVERVVVENFSKTCPPYC